MNKKIGLAALSVVIFSSIVVSLPSLFVWGLQYEQKAALAAMMEEFPVTVNPQNKTIIEDKRVNALFESEQSPLQAATANAEHTFWKAFELIATTINDTPWYQNIAGVAGVKERIVTITPGMRKEQVASAFGKALAWNSTQQKEFLTPVEGSLLPLAEGSFSPGVYTVTSDMTPIAAQALVNERFTEEILSHYATATAEMVSIDQALTVASLIEREAGGSDDMRMISGIIWNRLFANMNLQIDATIQYVKANNTSVKSWWPKVIPSDMARKSPYNTYKNSGLPPTPISNSSVASVLAALNPKETSCMYYFHDNARQFHCSDTYAQHVALLKQYFGRGK
ncbi:MAG: endolytic transglycosylase MltG [Candidatus Paceibacterota bacterium]|jgi:UPF0755 protein